MRIFFYIIFFKQIHVVIQKIAEEFQYLKTSEEGAIHSEGYIPKEFGASNWAAFTLKV